jgi:hypothetical protein
VSYADSYGEMTQRAWYAEWLRSMQRPTRAAPEVQALQAKAAP